MTASSSSRPMTIDVTGVGTSSTPPDAAMIDVGVQVVRQTVGEATSVAAQLARDVLQALKSHGVAAADITTRDYHVHPEHDHRPRRQPQPGPTPIVGYRVGNTLQLTIREPDRLSAIIDAATQAAGEGAMINSLRFGASDPVEAESLARAAAWADAQTRAEHLAQLAGVTLGPVVAMTESRRMAGGPPMPMRGGGGAAMAMAPPVEPGQTGITVMVAVTFGLEHPAAG